MATLRAALDLPPPDQRNKGGDDDGDDYDDEDDGGDDEGPAVAAAAVVAPGTKSFRKGLTLLEGAALAASGGVAIFLTQNYSLKMRVLSVVLTLLVLYLLTRLL